MKLSDVDTLSATCAMCRVCPNSAYQTYPVLGITQGDEPILVIAQNPGEIKVTDSQRMWWVERFIREKMDPHVMTGWYRWDFETSHGYGQFARVFGTDWLDSGKFAYTNSVRCRTPKNERPDDKMLEACKTYTHQLSEGRKAIIYVGTLAAQLIPERLNAKLKIGVPVKSRDGLILKIPHYAAWRDPNEVDQYRKAVDIILKNVKGDE